MAFLELSEHVRVFRQQCVEIFPRQRQQHTRRDRANGRIRRTVRRQIRLAEELSFGEERNSQIAAMHPFAQYFDLPLRDHEELAAILPFDQQLVPDRNILDSEGPRHALENGVGQPREQRHPPQGAGGERYSVIPNIHGNPFRFGKLHFGPIDAIGAAVDLHPRQELEQVTRRDRHHLG